MRRHLRTTAALAVLAAATIPAGRATADPGEDRATAPPPATCFTVADGTRDAVDRDAPDLLTRVAPDDPDPATNETDVGTGTGTHDVEAIALQPGTGVLFAADGGRLGTIDLDTGRFRPIGAFGEAHGPLGPVDVDDVDGLSFDAATGFLYGAQRERRGEDLLVRLDPLTGAVVAGALAGADYAVVEPVAGLPDVDDIALDPEDGRMYAVANDNGRRDRLVEIDKATGETTDIGVMEAQDVEGLGFAGGQLIGTTGKNHGREGTWGIDKATGAATNRRPLDNGRDYEAFDCLNPPRPPAAAPPGAACLEIVQDTVPDDRRDFAFLTSAQLGLVLDDDDDPALADTRTLCDLAPGSYTVTQVTPAGWPVTGVECTDPTGDTTVDEAAARAVAVLAGGETVRCVFRNTRTEVLAEDRTREPSALPSPLAARPAAAALAATPAEDAPAGPIPLPALPRTGPGGGPLVVLAGLALVLGGLAVIGGTRRPSPRR